MTYIYAYTKDNQAYIGKTKNPKHRKLAHKSRFGEWDYAVIDLVDSFSKTEWKPLESYWIEQFRQWGFTLENIKKEGGSGRDAFRTEEEHKEYMRQWYLINKERKAEYYKTHDKQYYLDNREKRLEHHRKADKKYYLKNREERKEKMKQYYQRTKSKIS